MNLSQSSRNPYINYKVGGCTIENLEKSSRTCLHFKAFYLDATGSKKYAWVKIYPMYKFSQGDQTYQEMDAHFESQLKLAKFSAFHLTKIYSTFDKKDSPHEDPRHIVLMKHYKDGDLRSFISKKNLLGLESSEKKSLMESLYRAVVFMHDKGFSHNSIDPDHIMVDGNTAYLGGLSSSKHHPEGLPQAARLKDLENLGGCLCFIEFGQTMVAFSADQMKTHLQQSDRIPAEIKQTACLWLEKQTINKIQGEKIFNKESFPLCPTNQVFEAKIDPTEIKPVRLETKKDSDLFISDVY